MTKKDFTVIANIIASLSNVVNVEQLQMILLKFQRSFELEYSNFDKNKFERFVLDAIKEIK